MNAPLTSNHHYVADLPNALELERVPENVRNIVRTVFGVRDVYPVLYYEINDLGRISRAWGCFDLDPKPTSRVYAVHEED